MRSACAEDLAQPTLTEMAFATTWTIASVHWMHAACAMAPVQSSHAVARAFRRATAIATATNLMPWAFAEALVKRI
jgi:hypothetical protein